MILKRIFTETVPLYLLTDTEIAGLTDVQITRQALSAGIKVIQLRNKDRSKKEIFNEAIALKSLTIKQKALLIINDHIDIAIAANADGVHLGQEDMPLTEARKIMGKGKIIGISTHSLKEAQKAEMEGADYIGFGPIFLTGTKKTGSPKGLKMLQMIGENINIPIVAIGGIKSENIREVLMSGADAAAIASGILSGNIRRNTKNCLKHINAVG